MTVTGTDTAPVVDAAESKRLLEQVQVENGVVRIDMDETVREFEVKELPEGLLLQEYVLMENCIILQNKVMFLL